MIVVDLSKQQALDADPKAIQQINFTANLDRAGDTRIYFILEEAKETIFDFSQGTVKVLWMQFSWVQRCWLIWFLSIWNDKIQQFKCKAIRFIAW